MKKLTLTIAIILGMAMTSFANDGLFNRANNAQNGASGYSFFSGSRLGDEGEGVFSMPGLPGHGEGTDQPAPLGSGIAVLMGLGAAYMVAKKRREE